MISEISRGFTPLSSAGPEIVGHFDRLVPCDQCSDRNDAAVSGVKSGSFPEFGKRASRVPLQRRRHRSGVILYWHRFRFPSFDRMLILSTSEHWQQTRVGRQFSFRKIVLVVSGLLIQLLDIAQDLGSVYLALPNPEASLPASQQRSIFPRSAESP